MLLYIIRHGEPIYAPDTLTPRGRAQAQALSKRLALHGLDRIYSSPLGRAQETAQPTAELLNLPVEILPWTREIWPEFALPQPDGSLRFAMEMPGTLYRSEENRTAGDAWAQLSCLSSIEAKKNYDMLVASSDEFLKSLGYQREKGVYRILRANEERVAVFCHAGFSLTWLPHLLAIPAHLFWSAFDITHSGVTLLRFDNDPSGLTAPKCLMLSDMSHIYKENLPYDYNGRLPV